MEFWIASIALWLVLVALFVRSRHGRTVAGWTRSIEFSPTERMAAEDLFGHLLSANLALLEHDDFNQMKSALCKERVDAILALHWGVTSKDECLRVLDRRLGCLGVPSPAETAAYTAWRNGWPIDSEACRALFETGKFLAGEARIIETEDIRDAHLSPMAWDIQQVAYLVRLGLAVGHLSREHADVVFSRLRQIARVHYQCWKDFSLSALIGMGMRSPIDPMDLRGWHRIARSHRVLLAAEPLTLSYAADWAGGRAVSTRPKGSQARLGFSRG